MAELINTDDVIADLEDHEPKVETKKEKAAREKAELEEKLKEYGAKIGFATLISLATPGEKTIFLFGIIAAIGHGVGQIGIQFFFGDMTDSLNAGTGLLEVMGPVVVKMAILGCIVGVLSGFYSFSFPWFVERQLKRIRPLYFDVCINRDIGWFDTHTASALSAEMCADLDQYAEGLGTKLSNSCMSSSMFFGGFALAFWKSWKLALVMTGSLPIMMVGFIGVGKAFDEHMKESQGGYAAAAAVMDECLFAIRTVVTFGSERRELTRFTGAVEVARKSGVKNRASMGFGFGYFMGTMLASYGLAFWFGGWLMEQAADSNDAKLTPGDILAAFGGVLMGGMSVSQGFPGVIEAMKARTSMTRFFYLLRNGSVIQRRKQDERREMTGHVETFELQNVHFSYPARLECKVLNGVSLKINKGEKVAFVGESGSGKSTVMSLLERFYDPTEGLVLVNNEDIRNFSIRSLRRSIGYVGQEPVLFATTIEENIRMGNPASTHEDIERCVKQAEMTSFLSKLPSQLATYVGTGGSQFSGGQKQRIAIARALLKKPSVLFLDEATSALDSASERMIQGTIDSLNQTGDSSMAIVSIAHRLSTIQNSDVIYVLRSGVVVEHGRHDELLSMQNGVYQALAVAQKVSLETGEDSELSCTEHPPTRSRAKSGDTTGSLSEVSKASSDPKISDRDREILKTYNVPVTRLLQFCKPEWWMIPPGCLFAMISGAVFPIMGGKILASAMSSLYLQDWVKIRMYCMLFAILGAVKFVSQFLQFTLFGVVGESLTKRCRIAILTTIMSQEIGFHDNPDHTPGQIAITLQASSYRVQRLAIAIGDTADAVCTLITGLFIGFYSCWQLSLFALAFMPVLGLAQALAQKAQMGGQKAENESVKSTAQLLQDAFVNAKTVHACGCEQELVELYTKSLLGMHDRMMFRHIKSGFVTGLSNGFVMWFIAATFYFMAWLIDEQHSDFENAFGAIMGLIYGAMMAASAFALTGDIGKAKVAAHDMFQILDRQSKIDGLNPTGSTQDLDGVGRIEFQDVQFYYPFRPDVKVLKGMSFTIEAGTSVGVAGPSGGGKSTIFALVQRFYDPQNGVVWIGSGNHRVDLSTVNIRWWRNQVGFVGQEPILFSGSVLDNVKYGIEDEASLADEHLEKCKQDAFLTFLDAPNSNGWQTQVGLRGARLSGGQKQRVAICRALVRNPKIILLDEATSALDSTSEAVVSAALSRARAGRTSFSIAHRLSTIQGCDMILVVADGMVVEQGPHDVLMKQGGVYNKLYQSSTH